MVQTLPPVPTTALSALFLYSYGCSIALAFSSTSLQAPAGQVIPSIIFSPLVINPKVTTGSGTGLAVVRACKYSGSSDKTSGADGSGDSSGGDSGDYSGGDHDSCCDDDGGGGGGGRDDGCFGSNFSSS